MVGVVRETKRSLLFENTSYFGWFLFRRSAKSIAPFEIVALKSFGYDEPKRYSNSNFNNKYDIINADAKRITFVCEMYLVPIEMQ